MNRVQDGIRRARQHFLKLCRRPVSRQALAAVAVAAMVAGGYFVAPAVTDSRHGNVVASNEISVSQIRGEVIASASNELRSERLPDGSLVVMAPGTRMQFDFSGSRRIVSLQRGKARFTVTPNPAKPFVVQTPLIDATAVGTSFTVSVTDCVRVGVHEGTVEISGRGAAGVVRTLRAGQSASQNCFLAALAESLPPR